MKKGGDITADEKKNLENQNYINSLSGKKSNIYLAKILKRFYVIL